ncbi:MAG TPA: DNA internalization-related competence protein ComEC/Rec2, partial [Clostridiales bacterium]|nr:DNA internalization-related competence protein ComEC/Rec2 [Clostridiales bacterium]
GSRSAGDIAADRLIALGHTQLDVLVLTHLDEDHCNGVPQLFRRLDIAQVVLPKGQPNTQALEMVQSLAQAEGAQLHFLADDTLQLPLGQASLTLFPPMGFGEANQSGLFALCSCQDFDVLITGDAGQFVEQMFLKYHTLPDLEVLVVGHHGASSSTHPQFLQRLSPEYALISVGYNTYNHPHPQVLARLEALGAQVLRTDQLGSITLSFRHGQVAQSP